ncbi:hypothetical protein EDB81DRAFT_778066 [Dactylonectria macrodidyma]|uniref:Cell wall protein PhiA n=1 Tax=Dactylonectria macrodidyma TaxID=307937 RepID=A0A9P9JHG5_9HYPO|nr:hypothetical protein EDB81DRAFT_778066 [Dactylonectria macrodidyma]
MQIKNLLLAPLVAAGVVSAAPASTNTFEVLSLRSASGIHFTGFQASNNNIRLKQATQGATCKSPTDNLATFKLVDGNLFLYHEGTTPQQLFVDRSGMGQGKLGYTTNVKEIPTRWERTGWAVDGNGDLKFKGVGFLACPSGDGSWNVWMNAGFSQPGGSSGCLSLTARAIKIGKPNSCTYTQ